MVIKYAEIKKTAQTIGTRFSTLLVCVNDRTAMVEAGKSDPAIQERVDLFSNRVPEELYHYGSDPDALINLIADPAYSNVLAQMRQDLANEMYRTDDFMLEKLEWEFGIKGTQEKFSRSE
jgi:N-sulfoglucosamine sulfohydrolase